MKTKHVVAPLVMLFIAFNLVMLNFNVVAAQTNQLLPQTEVDCKWSPEICPNGKDTRDVCLKDGSGATCTCGDVSCTC